MYIHTKAVSDGNYWSTFYREHILHAHIGGVQGKSVANHLYTNTL